MKETIKALFAGKLCPFENSGIQSDKYLKIWKQLSKKRQELLKLVDNKNLEEYDSLLSELSYYHEEDYFCQGFQLGVKLIMEALFIRI